MFFDLAFVLVVGELAVGLRNDLTLHGVLVFAGLFTSVWWALAGFTLYANRFDTDDVVYRLAKLAAMLAAAGLAASASDATESGSAVRALAPIAPRHVRVATRTARLTTTNPISPPPYSFSNAAAYRTNQRLLARLP